MRVIKVVAIGTRRGPAPEAALLFEDLAPVEATPQARRQKPNRLNLRRVAKAVGDQQNVSVGKLIG